MASLQALFCATTLLLVPYARTAMASTTLEDACESYAAGDRSSYDYCVWKLRRAAKGSAAAAADARGLAAIAARAARSTAKAAAERIAALRAAETVPVRRDSLAACAAEYAAAVRRLGRAARAAARREGGDLQRGQALLEEAAGATARCDAAFAAAGQGTPLDGEVRGLDDDVELAIALLPSLPATPTKT